MRKFTCKVELAAPTREIGGKPALPSGETLTIAFLLVLEPDKSMFEPGDRAKRCDRDRKLELVIGAGAHQRGVVAMAVFAETLAGILQFEPANRRNDALAFEAQLFSRKVGMADFFVRIRGRTPCCFANFGEAPAISTSI